MQKLNDTNWPHCAGIYCIINIVNNKKYVGSAVNIFKRIRRHNRELVYQYHNNTHLLASYIKYGAENFEVKILETFESIDFKELHDRENEYIKSWNLCNPKIGYNKRTNDEFPTLSHQAELIKKINPKVGKIKVMAFDQNTGEFYKEFESISAAARELHDQTTNISKCCDVTTRSCKGYVFIRSCNYDPNECYKKQYSKRTWTEDQKLKSLQNNKRALRVYVYNETGKLVNEFLSIRKANEFYEFPADALCHLLKKYQRITYNKLLFTLEVLDLDDFDEIWESTRVYLKGVVRNQFM